MTSDGGFPTVTSSGELYKTATTCGPPAPAPKIGKMPAPARALQLAERFLLAADGALDQSGVSNAREYIADAERCVRMATDLRALGA